MTNEQRERLQRLAREHSRRRHGEAEGYDVDDAGRTLDELLPLLLDLLDDGGS